MKAPVVVTGASGFVGQALIRALRHRGICVTGVARKSVGVGECVIVTDYRDTPCPPSATLVHLAEEANIPAAVARGAAHVAEVRERIETLCAKGFCRVVYASSGQIYRAHARKPDPYIAAKRAAEEIVLAAGGAVVRLANVYGPGMRQHTLVGDILRQIPGSGPLHIRSAAPRRDFLWIDDAAEGLAAVALGEALGVFDLGSGETVSAGEVARLALTAAGESDRPVFADQPSAAGTASDDVVLDITRMAALFGWRPQVGIAEGLTRLLKAGP